MRKAERDLTFFLTALLVVTTSGAMAHAYADPASDKIMLAQSSPGTGPGHSAGSGFSGGGYEAGVEPAGSTSPAATTSTNDSTEKKHHRHHSGNSSATNDSSSNGPASPSGNPGTTNPNTAPQNPR